MCKRVICFLGILGLLVSGVPAHGLGVSAGSAVVMEQITGQVLFSQNPHQRRSMASTTKIMTALLVIENADLKSSITATCDMVTVEGTSMGLRAGDVITYEGLCYGMLLESGNDAANAAALALDKSREAFAERMNRRAQELGMKNTHFVTPSGLDAEAHYSTAYDMALLARAAMANPTFAKIAGTKKATVVFGSPPQKRTLYNHNKLLSMEETVTGIKTGFTKKSGRCLVSAAEENGKRVVAVTLNDPNDWADHRSMLSYGLGQLEEVALHSGTAMPSEISVVGGTKPYAALETDTVTVGLPKGFGSQVSAQIQLPEFCYAPTQYGSQVGSAKFYWKDTLLAEAPIRLTQQVDAVTVTEPPPPAFWDCWKALWQVR